MNQCLEIPILLTSPIFHLLTSPLPTTTNINPTGIHANNHISKVISEQVLQVHNLFHLMEVLNLEFFKVTCNILGGLIDGADYRLQNTYFLFLFFGDR